MNGKLLSAQYKEHFSNFRRWEQLDHASEYLVYPENIGPHLSIDETCLSSGEVYTFLTNKEGHGGPGTLVAVIHGTKAETVIAVIEKIPLHKRLQVKEITLDLSSSMMLIARTVFPKARITNDRFHVQKLYYDAIDDLRVSLRWMARDLENEEMRKCREDGIRYVPFRYANGDTRKQLLARAKYILTKHESKWTKAQRWRADIIFEFYPELKRAYELAMELTDIFNRKCVTGKPTPEQNRSMPKSRPSEASSGEWLTYLSSCSDYPNCAHNAGNGQTECNRVFRLTQKTSVFLSFCLKKSCGGVWAVARGRC